ncbi:hypothetical protein PO124_12060 [Bacillus licheniformis]|nr:hypothetical protein [Bacillus licheniformis]
MLGIHLTLPEESGQPVFTERIRACSLLLHRLSAGIFSNSDTICQKRRVSHETCRRHSDLSEDLQLLSCNRAALHWLNILRGWESIGSEAVPRPVRAVCTRAAAETTAPAKRSSRFQAIPAYPLKRAV